MFFANSPCISLCSLGDGICISINPVYVNVPNSLHSKTCKSMRCNNEKLVQLKHVLDRFQYKHCLCNVCRKTTLRGIWMHRMVQKTAGRRQLIAWGWYEWSRSSTSVTPNKHSTNLHQNVFYNSPLKTVCTKLISHHMNRSLIIFLSSPPGGTKHTSRYSDALKLSFIGTRSTLFGKTWLHTQARHSCP